jgi:hypothetical protein
VGGERVVKELAGGIRLKRSGVKNSKNFLGRPKWHSYALLLC